VSYRVTSRKTFFVIAIVFISLFAGFKLMKKADDVHSDDRLPAMTFCKETKSAEMNWKAEVRVQPGVVTKDFSPETVVQDQIKFLDGFQHFAGSDRPRLILLPKAEVKINSVTQGEQLITITYSAKKPVVFCNDSGFQSSSIQLSLPYDPYSAYELVPKSLHRELSFYGEIRKVNPCADPQIVIDKDPAHYWYTWKPDAKGMDIYGNTFDCGEILKSGKDYQSVKAELREERNDSGILNIDPLLSIPRLKMAVVFGFVSGAALERTIADAKKFFRAYPQTGSDVFQDRHSQDAAVWAVVDFLKELKKSASVGSLKIEEQQDHLVLALDGQLNNSNQKISLEIFLGYTGVGSGSEKNFLVSALKTSHLVFYIGHSGDGTKIDWSSWAPQFSPDMPFQILGVIGCYSAEYYNPVYIDFRRAKNLKTVLLLSDFSSYRFLAPIAVLRYVDRRATQEPASLTQEIAKYLETGERVLVR
jgi:hypothetical protein